MHYDTLARQWHLEDSIKELDSVNRKIAKLLLRKDELSSEIIAHIGHEHEGQKTYEYSMWKIEIKTPCVYSFNKKLYESGDYDIPSEYNPIKASVAYTIDKKLCDKYLDEAPHDVREVLICLIDKRPGKASVTLKERI